MKLIGIQVPPDRLVGELPVAMRAVVAIARALAMKAKVLVLDEPTASLAAGEVEALFSVLRMLRDSGVALVFVSHRMDEVLELCDRVTVLRNGMTVGTATVSEVSRRDVVRMIVGRDVEQELTGERATAGAVAGTRKQSRLELLDLRGLTVGPVSIDADAGEIVGLTGIAGCGAPELGEILIGRVPAVEGAIRLNGHPFEPSNPLTAFRNGIAFVPADRFADGLVPSLTLRENLYLNPSVAIAAEAERSGNTDTSLGGTLRRHISWLRGERATAKQVLKRYNVHPAQTERETSTLSGGNAQKLLLAKWLSLEPDVLILNEPTAGVDVGAREQIYGFLREAAQRGTTCLVISSDFEEVVQLCHRALVFCRGRLTVELAGADLRQQVLTSAALGAVTA
jgi:ribose transport system ATP-binding protein